MGCDIHGYIEVKKSDWADYWDACMDIKSIIGRNYSMFATLFGVRNYDEFNAVAPDRGLPQNVSDEVKADFETWGCDAHSPSFITLQEFKNINWDEHGTTLSQFIDCYKLGENKPFASFISSSELRPADYRLLQQGETVTKGEITYKRNFSKKSDAKSKDWELLFSIMEQLQNFYDERAKEYASNDPEIVDEKPQIVPHVDTSRVRLVVWFDN